VIAASAACAGNAAQRQPFGSLDSDSPEIFAKHTCPIQAKRHLARNH
jgi:hypothetical protein